MRVVHRRRGDVIAKKATIIAVTNQKGGTGKTTTCENLGIGLAMEGKKVLLVDADPQGSLTISMGWQQPDELPTTLSTLMAKAMNDQPIQPGEGVLHHAEGVDLIPANIELAGLEVSLVNCMNREKMLKQVLEGAKYDYDFILLDCTPSLGMLTVNALAAADTTLIPVQAQYLSAKGLEQLLQTVQKVRRQINPKLKIEVILLTIEEMQERVDAATAHYHELGDSIKASEKRLAEIAVLKAHIINYAKTRPVYDAYRNSGYNKKFLEAHREQITLHKAAKAAFDEAGLKKLPKAKDLSIEYAELLKKKKEAYPDYRKARDEMQELMKAQKNVEMFFAEEKDTAEKEPTR